MANVVTSATEGAGNPSVPTPSPRISESQLKNLCALIVDLHPDDQEAIFRRLAAVTLRRSPKRRLIYDDAQMLLGALLSLGEIAALEETPEQREQLEAARKIISARRTTGA